MRPVTLLWALRSPCNLGCRYCYFGTIEDHRSAPASEPGVLSHLARTDLTRDEVSAFAAGLGGSAVGRVFLAGGEPLIWPPVIDLIGALKQAGIQVVIATNGIPLNRPHITAALLDLGVDAVSVSLDSTDPAYNDAWRPSRNSRDGWDQVVSGIGALLSARGPRPSPRVGIYTVITRRNLDAVTAVPALAAQLGCDYAVPQPIALDPGHPLHGELSLRPGDLPELADAFTQLYTGAPLQLPAPNYPRQVAATVGAATGLVHGCFGGHTLHFIEPDGSIWDCPSSLRIAATSPAARRNVRDAAAADLFGQPRGCASNCALFSGDCVNMWPLMGFDSFLHPGGPATTSTQQAHPSRGPA